MVNKLCRYLLPILLLGSSPLSADSITELLLNALKKEEKLAVPVAHSIKIRVDDYYHRSGIISDIKPNFIAHSKGEDNIALRKHYGVLFSGGHGIGGGGSFAFEPKSYFQEQIHYRYDAKGVRHVRYERFMTRIPLCVYVQTENTDRPELAKVPFLEIEATDWLIHFEEDWEKQYILGKGDTQTNPKKEALCLQSSSGEKAQLIFSFNYEDKKKHRWAPSFSFVQESVGSYRVTDNAIYATCVMGDETHVIDEAEKQAILDTPLLRIEGEGWVLEKASTGQHPNEDITSVFIISPSGEKCTLNLIAPIVNKKTWYPVWSMIEGLCSCQIPDEPTKSKIWYWAGQEKKAENAH